MKINELRMNDKYKWRKLKERVETLEKLFID